MSELPKVLRKYIFRLQNKIEIRKNMNLELGVVGRLGEYFASDQGHELLRHEREALHARVRVG